MRICLITSPGTPSDGNWVQRRCAELLATRHEVTMIDTGCLPEPRSAEVGSGVREIVVEPRADLAQTIFACDDHRRGAAVLAAIEDSYGADGPDYVEACDRRAPGFVALHAKRCGHPLLADALFATRIGWSAELTELHDGGPSRPDAAVSCDLERAQIRLADRILWPGGDVLGLYGRHYPFSLPSAVRVRPPFKPPEPAGGVEPRPAGNPLAILYMGELSLRKGALDLVEACLRLSLDDWCLTMVGADTSTAPMGQSVRSVIEAMSAEDSRIRIAEPASSECSRRRWAEHDLLVVPSRFDGWPAEALEGMWAGLPVLATPVGGLVEMVEPGVTGWLTAGVGVEPVRGALERLVGDRDALATVRASGAPAARFEHLADPEHALAEYEKLFAEAGLPQSGKKPRVRPSEPSVTAVVPYYWASNYVEEAVSSALGQTHGNLDVLIVNDGSFAGEDDDILLRLGRDPRVNVVTQLNQGEPSARNLGAVIADADYVVMLDADNILEEEFVARAIAAFRHNPELAYVSCWLRFVAPDGSAISDPAGYAPIGNEVVRDDSQNLDGDALAVLPRTLFARDGYRYEPTSGLQSDWELYRRLRQDGRFGVVLPERLARYRVHPESLMRSHDDAVHVRSWDEARARRRLSETRWTAEGVDRPPRWPAD